jgi:hypothetical protein
MSATPQNLSQTVTVTPSRRIATTVTSVLAAALLATGCASLKAKAGLGGSETTAEAPGKKKRDTNGAPCLRNAQSRLETIEGNYYPKWKENGPKKTIAWFARKDLEAARYMLTGKGFKVATPVCDGDDRDTEAFAKLESALSEMEELVAEIEKSKGVEFNGVRQPNHIVYLDESGEEVEHSDKF